MALLDLSLVTKSLIKLLEKNLDELEGAPSGVTFTPYSPNKLPGTFDYALSFHLYHVSEEPHFKNQYPVGGTGKNGIETTPMALCLYYILTAHNGQNDPTQPSHIHKEQEVFGHAIKTLHDYAIIDDNTIVGTEHVMDIDMRGAGNTIQVILRPIVPEEALPFWSSDDTHLAKLSAYYEVRVVFMEPEEAKSMPGTVLSVGTFVEQLGVTSIACTESAMQFELPKAYTGVDGQTHETTVSPARPLIDEATHLNFAPDVAEKDDRKFDIVGTRLSGGIGQRLRIQGPFWKLSGADYTPWKDVIRVDPTVDLEWDLANGSDRRTVTIDKKLKVPDGAGTTDLKVVPGNYQVSLAVQSDSYTVHNQTLERWSSSNEVGLSIAPKINSYQLNAPSAGLVTIRLDVPVPLSATWNANNDAGDGNEAWVMDVQVVIDGEVYIDKRVAGGTATAPTGAKEFNTNTAGVDELIVLKPHVDISTPGKVYPIQIIINGAASYPAWIEVPTP